MIFFDEKLLYTLFVDDSDGVDAVLYDTGPVDENSPGIKEEIKIFDALSQVSEIGTFGTLVNGRSSSFKRIRRFIGFCVERSLCMLVVVQNLLSDSTE